MSGRVRDCLVAARAGHHGALTSLCIANASRQPACGSRYVPQNMSPSAALSNFLCVFAKKVLTYLSDSCNIIQVADRHGNETAEQALNGWPLRAAEKLRKNFKKVVDKLV